MWSYTLRRLLATIPTLLAVITVCYFMLHAAPGGPFDSDKQVSEAVLANLQAKYHLDKPLWQQYLTYMDDLVHGDMGPACITSARSPIPSGKPLGPRCSSPWPG